MKSEVRIPSGADKRLFDETVCPRCKKRIPTDRERGLIARIRREKGQFALSRISGFISFCTCTFRKPKWLRHPLEVKTVLVFYYARYFKHKNRRKKPGLKMAVSILNDIPRWAEQKKPRTKAQKRRERTLRRIVEFGDDLLYGWGWWPQFHPKLALGDVISHSSEFLTRWALWVDACRTPAFPSEPVPGKYGLRQELKDLADFLSFFLFDRCIDPYPDPVDLGPQTEADREMTVAYNRVADDYAAAPYNEVITGSDLYSIDAHLAFEECYGPGWKQLFDLRNYSNDQLLNSEHIKRREEAARRLLEHQQSSDQKCELERLNTRSKVCLPSPQYIDLNGPLSREAVQCWRAVFFRRTTPVV